MKKRRVIPVLIAVLSIAAMIYSGIFWAVSVVAAVMVLAVLLFLFYDRNEVLNERQVSGVFGTTEFKISTLVKFGRSKIFELKKINAKIEDRTVKKRVERIIEICDAILNEMKKNPVVVKKLRRFFNYYLDSLVKIMKRYESISNFGYAVDGGEEIIERTRQSLDLVCSSFEKLLKSLKEIDAADLDLEIQVMSKALGSEFADIKKPGLKDN